VHLKHADCVSHVMRVLHALQCSVGTFNG